MPSLPQQLLTSLSALDHFDAQDFILAHEEERKLTSIRLNPFKKVQLDFETGAPVKWNSEGYYLDERPSFTLDPLFQAGCYYPQEAGSMFLEFALEQVMDLSQSLNILDLCAAPGGKSTQLNSLMNGQSLLVANELVKSRAEILVQNLGKWGTSNTVVTNNEPQRFSGLASFFDLIVLDAPCSGSGLFRKQPEAIEEWSPEHVKACSIRQQKIIAEALPALKEDGILFYSTCSYSVEENEQIVEKLVKEYRLEFVPLPIDKSWGIVESSYGYRFYPHLTKSEGFFCAVLRKKTGELSSQGYRKNSLPAISKQEQAVLSPFLAPGENRIFQKNGQFHLLSPAVWDFMAGFEKHFYFKKAGVAVGEIKGKDLIPNQELAWFTGLNKEINRLELDKENALKFLKKETLAPGKNINGLALMCYRDQGLGWAKILPNRINNYLPNHLRILM